MRPNRPALLVLVVLLSACVLGITTGRASAASPATTRRRRQRRALKQVTLYVDTPVLSASGSVDARARAGLSPDATVHVGGGAAASGAAALRSPLLAALGAAAGTEEDGRPQATTAAYVSAPLSIARTIRPTVGFHFGEARGAAASGTAGGYAVGEFAYNPIANQLGASVASSSAGTVNRGSADALGGVVAAGDAAGLSGAESLGWVDAQTTAGGGRGGQESQAIAYPTNALSPFNPATCTGALTWGAARSNYVDGSAVPLIRGNDGGGDGVGGGLGVGGGAWGVPLCLALFDWGTLDDFVAFVEDGPSGRRRRGDEGGGNDGEGEEEGEAKEDVVRPSSSPAVSFEDYVVPGGGQGGGQGNGGGGKGGKGFRRRERDALRMAAAGDAGGGEEGDGGAESPPRSVRALADAFDAGGQAAVERFLQGSDLGREMVRRAETTRLRRERAYERGERQTLRATLANAAAALSPSANEARRAAAELRGVAARNATNLAVQSLVAVAESAEPALALQQRLQRSIIAPFQRASGNAAAAGLTRAAQQLERQASSAPAGGGGGAGGGGLQQALGDAAAALRDSAALAASDAADAIASSTASLAGATASPSPSPSPSTATIPPRRRLTPASTRPLPPSEPQQAKPAPSPSPPRRRRRSRSRR